MATNSDMEAIVVTGFALIVGIAGGLIATHWFSAAPSVGIGMLSFLVSFFFFATQARG